MQIAFTRSRMNTEGARHGTELLDRIGLQMLGYDPRKDFEDQGYRVFSFDAVAKDITADALMEELPARVAAYADGIQFGALFADLTNETVATREMLEKAIHELVRDSPSSVCTDSERRDSQVQSCDKTT